jgi:hypothetical protein
VEEDRATERTASADQTPTELLQETGSSQKLPDAQGENQHEHLTNLTGDEQRILEIRLRVATEERKCAEAKLTAEREKREERRQAAEARKKKQQEKEEKERQEKAEAEKKVTAVRAAATRLAVEAEPLKTGFTLTKLRDACKQSLVSKGLSPLPQLGKKCLSPDTEKRLQVRCQTLGRRISVRYQILRRRTPATEKGRSQRLPT